MHVGTTIRNSIRQLLPPIVVSGIRYLWVIQRHGAPEWEYMPQAWATQDPRIKGWNVESVLETQKTKWPQFLRSVENNGPLGIAHGALMPSNNDYAGHNTLMSYAYVLALATQKTNHISLLDWGGGIGHYYLISKALLPDVDIDYHCKDLPRLCQYGRELLPQAHFYEEDDECFRRSYDLVLVSSSLQYSEDWRGTVARLASISRPYLFVTRLPIVHSAPSFVVIQRPYRYGYQTEYLGWFLNREEFLTHVRRQHMEVVREFLIAERPYVHKAPEQGECRGYLFRTAQERAIR